MLVGLELYVLILMQFDVRVCESYVSRWEDLSLDRKTKVLNDLNNKEGIQELAAMLKGLDDEQLAGIQEILAGSLDHLE